MDVTVIRRRYMSGTRESALSTKYVLPVYKLEKGNGNKAASFATHPLVMLLLFINSEGFRFIILFV